MESLDRMLDDTAWMHGWRICGADGDDGLNDHGGYSSLRQLHEDLEVGLRSLGYGQRRLSGLSVKDMRWFWDWMTG